MAGFVYSNPLGSYEHFEFNDEPRKVWKVANWNVRAKFHIHTARWRYTKKGFQKKRKLISHKENLMFQKEVIDQQPIGKNVTSFFFVFFFLGNTQPFQFISALVGECVCS